MRLTECYIENFGIYREYSTKFNTGLNCRLSENGSGKTTLTAFIAAMLYGMPETRKQSLSENERKKYMPWQGGAYGGSLTLEVSGKLYTIERLFGSKPSDDSFTLRDTVRGTVSTDYSERIGEELFGIDRDGFLRTVFLSEKNLSLSNENKSISAKLSDLVGVDGDVGGFDNAISLLDERRKFYYKKSGRCEINNTRALLAEKRAELDTIDRRLMGATERAAALDELTAKRQGLEEQKLRLSGELIKSTEESKKRLDLERYRELTEKHEKYEKRKEELLDFFGGKIPSQGELDEMRFALLESERIEVEEKEDCSGHADAIYEALSFEAIARAERASAELSSLEDEILRLSAEKEEAPKEKEKRKKPSFPAICTLSLGAIVTLIGIILGFGVPILFLVAALGAVLLTAGAVMLISGGSPDIPAAAPDTDTRLTAITEKAARLREMLSEFCTELGQDGMDISASLTKIKEEYTRYYTASLSRASDREGREIRLASARKQRERVAEFLSRYKIDAEEPLSYLSGLVTELEYTSIECEKARLLCQRFAEENKLDATPSTLPLRSSTELGEEISKCDAELARGREEYSVLERQCEADLTDRERRDELSSEIALLEERLNEYVKTLEVIQGTMQYLEEACNNMTSRYIGKTEESFKAYEKALGGSGGSFAVGTDFTVTKNEHGAARSEESYSRGTRDLLALSIRLALINSLYENERPFIILDDPFIALDDERTKDGIRLLRELAKDRQILYFTCSKSREI